ncbi:zinc-dependent alcohol dehydrogenase family protein [Pelagibius litoralis]|uniref:enoyl-[acyl-carrier-protein] reductase n=1 Tax=Pelagibius litoralis TaxID=374515 RepID=A0A967C9G9_9PROT|nr:zinc-dependent alcohol dehydrogenase family protein [Pelagibius litoralis]NIA69097.1 zinc-dependent alcohol dehydrogenase family protein [Pelagibius litoralis]
MLAVQLQRHARPDLACAAVEVPEPGAPAPGEAVVAIRAAAINPADLLIFEGRYPGPEELPAFVGIEGAGEVVAVGEGVDLAPGDHVLSLGRANWAEKVTGRAEQFIRIPKSLAWRDAAQLKANPPSAHLMLEDYIDLQPGDWVVQNAANSAVGRHIIRFARARGLKTANIARRPALIEELSALGADVVVTDDGDVPAKIRAAAGAEAPIRLGIDAIGGDATLALADTLSDGGTVVNYGFISGEPCRMSSYHTVIHGLSLTGFWLVGYMRSTPRFEIEAMYAEMARAFEEGVLISPVEAEYTLAQTAEALAHAHAEGRGGKILLTPNGPL